MTAQPRIQPRDRDAIIQSLAAGLIPARGQQHIQVGRAAELKSLLRDLERVADRGSAIRFIIGRYGSGKTFFLRLVLSVAQEQRIVTMHADLSGDRRLHGSDGQARKLYVELAQNLAVRGHPEGGAIAHVVERFVSEALQEASQREIETKEVIRERLGALRELAGGYDFAAVVESYWRGHEEGREDLKAAAVRWLRGEYATKRDARRDLGVRTIIDDQNWYEHLKLFARFVKLAGYKGLLIALDEMVILYKLPRTQSREANYERILGMVNDCLQGNVEYLGFLLGGTPEFLEDRRRGLYSYEALETRLAENPFATNGRHDFNGPVIRVANLAQEELYVLLQRLRHVHASGDAESYLLPDEALTAFMEHCSKRLGAAYFQTPRNVIKAFVHLLNVLEQNPDTSWRDLLGSVEIEEERNPDLEPFVVGDDQPDEAQGREDDRLLSLPL